MCLAVQLNHLIFTVNKHLLGRETRIKCCGIKVGRTGLKISVKLSFVVINPNFKWIKIMLEALSLFGAAFHQWGWGSCQNLVALLI